ncbi:hypothetical protein FIU89_11635 [Roseovarius sp. THAF27]|nr:hypothetical protein FIU89_11635 [Roseovarius sp. THAF27]
MPGGFFIPLHDAPRLRHTGRGSGAETRKRHMTNKIALFLALLIIAGLGWDYYYNDMQASFFLARKTVDLIEWLAFWR